MKRTKLRKKSKSKQKQIEDELWELCRKIVFSDYGNTCYTCGKTGLVGRDLQCGHFIPKSVCGAYLKYDIRNLRPQCVGCNISEGGQGALFYQMMQKREGATYVNELIIDKQRTVKAVDRYTELLEKYKKLV